jgi:hypothetical protein
MLNALFLVVDLILALAFVYGNYRWFFFSHDSDKNRLETIAISMCLGSGTALFFVRFVETWFG